MTSMEEDRDETYIKGKVFSGKKKDWRKFSRRHLAIAALKKASSAYQKGGDSNLPTSEDAVIDVSTDAGKKAQVAKLANMKAMAMLTLAIEDDTNFAIVEAGSTDAWPGGLAHKVWEALNKKYAPTDTMSIVELKQELQDVSMNKATSPDAMFGEFDRLKASFIKSGKPLEKEDLVAQVMIAAPESYQSVLAGTISRLKDKITVDDMKECMEAQWRMVESKKHQHKSHDGSDNSAEKGVALAAFEGDCFECGKKGHRQNECPNRGGNGGRGGQGGGYQGRGGRGGYQGRGGRGGRGKFMGPCFECGKTGHRKDQCWELTSNASRRPQGWTSSKGGNKGGGEVSEVLLHHIEYETSVANFNAWTTSDVRKGFLKQNQCPSIALCNIAMPTTGAIAVDPNIWLADSCASSNMTYNGGGMVNVRKENHAISLGNKETVLASSCGKLSGTVYSQFGKPVVQMSLEEVSVVKELGYNLFSVTQALKKGWTLHGDSTQLELQKGNQKITFDIKIPTKKGFVFRMYFKRTHEMAMAATDKGTKMTVDQAHAKTGHCSEALTRKTAKYLGWDLSRGTMTNCAACAAAGKAKQKNMPKQSEGTVATKPGERLFMDIATIKKSKKETNITNPN